MFSDEYHTEVGFGRSHMTMLSHVIKGCALNKHVLLRKDSMLLAHVFAHIWPSVVVVDKCSEMYMLQSIWKLTPFANDGRMMVPIAERLVARGNPCKKVVVKAAGQNNGRIRLKLCGPMATIRGQNQSGVAMVLSSWHVPQARAT